NNISKCFFGLYANNAKNVFLIGNILHDNIIYNFDPHDFSDKLIIARNISYNAGHAHGIILSREVYNSTIAENITFANHGSGIMLDRNCEDNLIYKNLSFENSGDGIAIFESSKNIVSKNTILRNNNNGIFVRNSHNVLVKDNFIYHNGNNGAEISIVNIDALETRDFELDPYEKKAQASFIRNHFEKNTNAALSIKNRASFFFKNNILKNSGPVYFSGEIEDIANEIFQNNDTKGFSYTPTEVKK
ncbi:MAG: right-handed parallel beta-helix repeat-containing protein, partial [Campylobacterota bacterium]|nr:right-handed parallel beta-helix repeat-containing protein [Campylobacterota bacterium]